VGAVILAEEQSVWTLIRCRQYSFRCNKSLNLLAGKSVVDLRP